MHIATNIKVMKRTRFPLLFILVFTVFSFSACTDYWWSRGQPPSVAQLYSRAEAKLNTALVEEKARRKDIFKQVTSIKANLGQAYSLAKQNKNSAVSSQLEIVLNSFYDLEEKLSYGSRPAYGELSGQLRTIKNSLQFNKKLNVSALGLFTARTFFLLADEMRSLSPEPLLKGKA